MRAIAAVLAVLCLCGPARADDAETRAQRMESKPVAILQGLDKITARVQRIEAPVGETIGFGPLRILPRDCRKAPPIDQPEAASYLQVWEIRPANGEKLALFGGWMFASSPGLSSLEHPVYDVWLIDCADQLSGAAPAEPAP